MTILVAVAFIARGIFLGRPVTAAHAWMAVALLFGGFAARIVVSEVTSDILIIGAGIVLMWPTSARPEPR